MPCQASCSSPSLEDKIRSAAKELKELGREKAAIEKGKLKARLISEKAEDAISGLSKSAYIALVFGEGKQGRVEGNAVCRVSQVKSIVRRWAEACDNPLKNMTFSVVKALGRNWLLSWHDHE